VLMASKYLSYAEVRFISLHLAETLGIAHICIYIAQSCENHPPLLPFKAKFAGVWIYSQWLRVFLVVMVVGGGMNSLFFSSSELKQLILVLVLKKAQPPYLGTY
jgi:hypothetical protein